MRAGRWFAWCAPLFLIAAPWLLHDEPPGDDGQRPRRQWAVFYDALILAVVDHFPTLGVIGFGADRLAQLLAKAASTPNRSLQNGLKFQWVGFHL